MLANSYRLHMNRNHRLLSTSQWLNNHNSSLNHLGYSQQQIDIKSHLSSRIMVEWVLVKVLHHQLLNLKLSKISLNRVNLTPRMLKMSLLLMMNSTQMYINQIVVWIFTTTSCHDYKGNLGLCEWYMLSTMLADPLLLQHWLIFMMRSLTQKTKIKTALYSKSSIKSRISRHIHLPIWLLSCKCQSQTHPCKISTLAMAGLY